jgi:hypothetical protein
MDYSFAPAVSLPWGGGVSDCGFQHLSSLEYHLLWRISKCYKYPLKVIFFFRFHEILTKMPDLVRLGVNISSGPSAQTRSICCCCESVQMRLG